jgi:hypothetical protein
VENDLGKFHQFNWKCRKFIEKYNELLEKNILENQSIWLCEPSESSINNLYKFICKTLLYSARNAEKHTSKENILCVKNTSNFSTYLKRKTTRKIEGD